MRETGYSELFSVEYMQEKDGKDYFLEMNSISMEVQSHSGQYCGSRRTPSLLHS